MPTDAAVQAAAERTVRELVEVLAVEPLGDDRFRATSPQLPGRRNTFGGQVMAQALHAACRTVDQGRLPHSLHAYFLREGRFDEDLVLSVERTFDGRSHSTRHVAVLQGAREIFALTASFRPTGLIESPDERIDGAGLDDPDDVPTVGPELPEVPVQGFSSAIQGVDAGGARDGSADPAESRFWMRVRTQVPDDPVLHACLLAYICDSRAGMSIAVLPVEHELAAGDQVMMASLDHAMWFHRPARADDWLLFRNGPRSVSAARGLVTGTVQDRFGRHVASFAQELLDRHVPAGG